MQRYRRPSADPAVAECGSRRMVGAFVPNAVPSGGGAPSQLIFADPTAGFTEHERHVCEEEEEEVAGPRLSSRPERRTSRAFGLFRVRGIAHHAASWTDKSPRWTAPQMAMAPAWSMRPVRSLLAPQSLSVFAVACAYCVTVSRSHPEVGGGRSGRTKRTIHSVVRAASAAHASIAIAVMR